MIAVDKGVLSDAPARPSIPCRYHEGKHEKFRFPNVFNKAEDNIDQYARNCCAVAVQARRKDRLCG